ncbi:YihY/virulence factor BrkB family protein [Marivita sp. GX14005]|uniref:YihY/virulence factor BrkB family protein n=1 Tax=Marivita sp. GX14005 TaxID=2942276 RepID=UPI002019F956|nr:YihY/virulence factor BrkB family protein [Marivita sp. GX14005]MCL3881452.1 YihY/virulence factor BrkB family protein [Marivita sp. GX14005]
MARGRSAESPTDIPSSGWKDVALRVKDNIGTDRIGLIAAGIAFYGLLALFPAITALLAISGLVVEPTEVVNMLERLSGLMPEQALTIIMDQATKVAGSQTGGLGLAAILGILIAVYSASKGMGSLIQGVNVAYGEEETRGFVKLKLITIALTLFLLAGMVVALVATIALPVALEFLNIGGALGGFLTVALIGLLFVMTMLGLAVIYRYGPSRDEPQWQWASVGAVLACVAWLIASAGFAFYVANFGSYNESFGALAGVVVLLMWFWISAYVILIGAEVNAEMEAQTREDTTQGAEKPMGERDAVKADYLGEAAGK